jgi:hypothetical protein
MCVTHINHLDRNPATVDPPFHDRRPASWRQDGTVPRILPATPEAVALAIAALVNERTGRVRLALDGAPAADPAALAQRVVAALESRPTVHVRSDRFWRPASIRFERGRRNPSAWLHDWLDDVALRREVLDRFLDTGLVLPELRDPVTDRSVKASVIALPANGVVIVSGTALLGRGLPFDATVHIRLSPAALERRTPTDLAWTLPALATYQSDCRPDDVADLVIRDDDPRHPAIVERSRLSG